MIVDDPSKGIAKDNIIAHWGNGQPCKHLHGDTPGEMTCGIHHFRWYEKTPCFTHGQIERSKDCVCRMGEYQMKLHKESQ